MNGWMNGLMYSIKLLYFFIRDRSVSITIMNNHFNLVKSLHESADPVLKHRSSSFNMLEIHIPTDGSKENQILDLGCYKLNSAPSNAHIKKYMGLPWWLRWQWICLQCSRPRLNPWVRKIPWRREGLSTPVSFPGELHGQRNLEGFSPWGHKQSDTTEWLTLFFFPPKYMLKP